MRFRLFSCNSPGADIHGLANVQRLKFGAIFAPGHETPGALGSLSRSTTYLGRWEAKLMEAGPLHLTRLFICHLWRSPITRVDRPTESSGGKLGGRSRDRTCDLLGVSE